MDVIHKTFPGGYKFGVFEGQPANKIVKFKPVNDVVVPSLLATGSRTAADVLNALGLTAFDGPESALVSTEGMIEPSKVKNIIISAVEVEPYDLPNVTLLLGENKSRFISGLKSINKSYSKAKITIVLGDNQKQLIQVLKEETTNIAWVDLVTMPSKYPANLKELSISTILDKKYPVGYAPAHIGVLFLSVAHVLSVSKVVTDKQGLTSTYVSLSGPGWKENLVLDVPVGTLISDIKAAYLGDNEVRLIKNSVLTKGVFSETDRIAFDTSVIIALPEDRSRKSFFFLRGGKHADSFSNAFLSSIMPKAQKTIGTNVNGERRACVSCTFCQTVCPVGLIPQLLHKHVDKKIINKRLAEYRIFDCIECGLCDYVCTSKIEISTDIKRGKELLEANGISHTTYSTPKCDMINKAKEVATHE